MNEQTRYEKFIEALTALSVEHGVTLNVTGGVTIHDEGVIRSVVYDSDSTSGDLNVRSINGKYRWED
mgnify:CR=1 FL=1